MAITLTPNMFSLTRKVKCMGVLLKSFSLAMLAGSLICSAAMADDADADGPYITPQKDVDITYSMLSPFPKEPPTQQRMRWSVARLQQRVDPAKTETYMITDYKQKKLTVVDPIRKIVTTMPAPGAALTLPGVKATGDYHRTGEANVAGLHCTEWHAVDTEGRPSEVCYGDDGVLLRVVQRGLVMVKAIKVDYAPQPESIFTPPSNFRTLQPAH